MNNHQMTRGELAGREMANALVEFIHLMYQKQTGYRVMAGLIDNLSRRLKEFNLVKGEK